MKGEEERRMGRMEDEKEKRGITRWRFKRNGVERKKRVRKWRWSRKREEMWKKRRWKGEKMEKEIK